MFLFLLNDEVTVSKADSFPHLRMKGIVREMTVSQVQVMRGESFSGKADHDFGLSVIRSIEKDVLL